MNAEFQRIARRDKKAFFSDQCKEIEENNRMGKTRDLFKVPPAKHILCSLYMNHELPDVQAGLRKAKEPEIKLPTSAGSWKKQESSRKTSISVLLTMPKPLTVWIKINCGKF